VRLLGRPFRHRGNDGEGEFKGDAPFDSGFGACARVAQVLIYVNSSIETVRDCLDAALESFKGHDFLIICDSREATTRGYLAGFAAEHSSRLVLNLDYLGYYKSVVKGMQLSDAQYLVALDTGVTPTAGSLRQLVEHLNSQPHAEVAIPMLDIQLIRYLKASAADGSDTASFVRGANPELIAAALDSTAPGVSCPSNIDVFRGYPCFAVRRSAFSNFAAWKLAGDSATSQKQESHAGALVKVSLIVVPSSYASCRLAYLPNPDAQEIQDLSGLMESLRPILKSSARIARLARKGILFLLPSPGGNGGAHSVVQEVIGLRRCGLDARIANLATNQRAFEHHYPEATSFCSYPSNDAELLELAAGPVIVIATNYTSVSSLKTIIDRNPAAVPLYYVQDYEPWFYPEHSAQYGAAKASYDLVPNARAFAKTEWLCRTVRRMTGIAVTKIDPSLDRSLYNSLEARRDRSGPVAITAMIRPNSARRNPRGTLDLLRKIKYKYGRAVDIRIFGCSDEELDQLEEARGFDLVNFGELKRTEVAEVLRGADIFADLSISQAFGCTGLEAIAVGCATVLPRDSGVEEYAIDGRNSLLVDSSNEAEAISAVERLISDTRAEARFKTETANTSLRYSVRIAVWSLLRLFADACEAQNARQD
jgi:O-antigen biosynthesis protein